jgi:hypothetical protein
MTVLNDKIIFALIFMLIMIVSILEISCCISMIEDKKWSMLLMFSLAFILLDAFMILLSMNFVK